MATIDYVREMTFEYAVLETVSPNVRRIVARNPGPFTFHGTGTYVVGHGKVAIIDPGPDLAEHIDAVLHALRNETVESLVVTHTHVDHSPAWAAIKRATGAATYGFGPHGGVPGEAAEQGADRSFVPEQAMVEGDTLAVGGNRLTAIHTPGHTSNHLCFALEGENLLFSGDHVMGWSTSVIVPPDGNMADYMTSLEKLLRREDAIYLPTHGPAITAPRRHVESFIAHRRERRDGILRELGATPKPIFDLVDALYLGLNPALRPAAARSVFAHLIELVDLGLVKTDGAARLDGLYWR
jgi:glyoxylase-like metal-dependent hydrolase (beta-lactamase superfamily II)